MGREALQHSRGRNRKCKGSQEKAQAFSEKRKLPGEQKQG